MRTFVECRIGSDEALYHRHIWQEVGNAYDGLASAIQAGDVKKQALESARLDEALIAADIYSTQPAPVPPTPPPQILLPPKFTAAERVVKARGEEIAASKQVGRAVAWAREFLPIVERYVS